MPFAIRFAELFLSRSSLLSRLLIVFLFPFGRTNEIVLWSNILRAISKSVRYLRCSRRILIVIESVGFFVLFFVRNPPPVFAPFPILFSSFLFSFLFWSKIDRNRDVSSSFRSINLLHSCRQWTLSEFCYLSRTRLWIDSNFCAWIKIICFSNS